MSSIKISELTEAEEVTESDLLMIIQNNANKKIKVNKIGGGKIIQETGTASTDNVYSAVAVDNKLKTNIVTGEEAATNEYIDGKQVFVKRIDFGILPDTAEKKVELGLNLNVINITKIDGVAKKSGTIFTIPFTSCVETKYNIQLIIRVDDEIPYVVIQTNTNRSELNGYINIYYTKN